MAVMKASEKCVVDQSVIGNVSYSATLAIGFSRSESLNPIFFIRVSTADACQTSFIRT